ncbi:MAG: hypothetical protein AAGF58_00835 [Pseudomonadota bacterium]
MKRIAWFATIIGLLLSGTAFGSDGNIIADKSIRVMGFHANSLAYLIKKHDLAPEDVRVIGPDEAGDVSTVFVMLLGWESVGQVTGAQEICAELCEATDRKLQLVSRTIVEGDVVQKMVFVDLNQLAPEGNIIGSFGLSGCVVDQVFNEARLIKPKTEVCLARLAGGTFTDRRAVDRR